MKRSEVIILTVAVAVVASGLGFSMGRISAPRTQAVAANGVGGQSGFAGGSRRAGGRPIFGSVTSLSGSSLTVTDTAGTPHVVTLSANTVYTSGDGSTSASQTDLTAGTQVATFGRAAADGSITASRVVINPSTPSQGSMPPASTQAN